MYIPKSFRVEETAKLVELMRQNSFATLITHDGSSPFASHVPLLYEPGPGAHGKLLGHVALANPQWKHFSHGHEALAIFHGPHGYISPTWYQSRPEVPTWNYAVVHAYGVPALITEQEPLWKLLRQTISFYESSQPQPWDGNLPAEYRERLMKAIVGFEIPITRIEGKFKLGQNRLPADAQGAIRALEKSNDPMDHALAKLMAEQNNIL